MNKPMMLPPKGDGTPFTTLDSLVRAVVSVPKKAVVKAESKWKRAKDRKRVKRTGQ